MLRWVALIAVGCGAPAGMAAQEYAGRPERFGASVPEMRGSGDDVRLRVRVESLAVAAVLHLVPDGPVVVAAVRVLEPGRHDLPVVRMIRQEGVVRVPFVTSSDDRMGRAAPPRSPRPAPAPSRVPVEAILILADTPLDSAVLEARLAEGMLVHPDSLPWQVPPALIRDPTTVWAAIRVQRR